MNDDTTTTTTTTTDRPASMSAALASVEASSASTPVTDAATSDQSAATTVQPDATTQAQETVTTTDAPTKGAPPTDKWETILSNARTKEAERVRAEIETQYAGLKDFAAIPDSDRPHLMQMYREFSADPAAAAVQMIQRLERDPRYATQLRSLAARTLANGRQAQPAAKTDPMPEPDLQAQDGTLVYSAPQMQKLREYDQRQMLAQLDHKLQPYEQDRQAAQTERARAQGWNEVAQVLTEFRTADPEFAKHEKSVNAELAKDERLQVLADTDPKQALEIAWTRVWKRDVLPTQQRQAETSVLTTLQQRAVAATTNPATASTATPRRPRSMSEALAQQGA